MPKIRLTDLSVKRVTAKLPTAGRVDYFDSTLPAFGLRVSSTGAASWFLFYRVDGKQVRDIFARFPAKGLKAARQEARNRLELLDRGRDPRQEEARQHAHEAKRRAETFGSVADTYHTAHLAKLSRGEELWQRVKDDLLPAWKDLPIRDLGRGAVMTVLDAIEKDKGIYARNRRLALIRNLLNFALDRELVDANVAARFKMLDEPKRQRSLTDAELVEVWQATGLLEDTFRRYARMLLLTGQRRSEVSDAPWEPELDEAERLWTIAPERMKARLAHVVPLSPAVMAILAEFPAGKDRGQFVFSTGRRGDTPISGFNSLKRQIDQHIVEARRKIDPDAKPMPDWRLHDLRRTFRSGLSRLRIPSHIAERVIAHLPAGIEATYDRFEYLDEKRHALEAWAAFVEQLVNPQPKVTPIEQARQKRARKG
jgi:integrase